MWLVKLPVPTRASRQIASACRLDLDCSLRHGQTGRPRVVDDPVAVDLHADAFQGRRPPAADRLDRAGDVQGDRRRLGAGQGPRADPAAERDAHVAAADHIGPRDAEQGQDRGEDECGDPQGQAGS